MQYTSQNYGADNIKNTSLWISKNSVQKSSTKPSLVSAIDNGVAIETTPEFNEIMWSFLQCLTIYKNLKHHYINEWMVRAIR